MELPDGKKHAVFITHDWGAGDVEELGRNNHARAAALNQALTAVGVPTWFDEEKMEGNVNVSMFSGVDASALVLVCVTQRYMHRVAGNDTDDPVYRAFELANAHLGRERILPVAMEARVLDKEKWTGLLRFHLSAAPVVNLTDDSRLEQAVHGGIAQFLAASAPR